MPPSIRVTSSRRRVLFRKKPHINHDHDHDHDHNLTRSMSSLPLLIYTTTTPTTTKTVTTTATTTTTTTTSHPRLPRTGAAKASAVDNRTVRRGQEKEKEKENANGNGSGRPKSIPKQKLKGHIMDPAGSGNIISGTSDLDGVTRQTLGMDRNGTFIPDLFTMYPPLKDPLDTETSLLQDETVYDCLPLLAGIDDPSRNLFDFNSHGLPRLEREKHVTFLHDCLKQLPARFVAFDPSRPWIVYWVLAGLCMLGEDVQQYRERFIAPKRKLVDSEFSSGMEH